MIFGSLMAAIVLEGTDGSGKTSVADEISKIIDSESGKGKSIQIYSSKMQWLTYVRKYVNENLVDTLARYIYYLSANAYSAAVCAKDGNITSIFDRYIYSTYATHIALDELHNGGRHAKAITSIFEEERKHMLVPDTVAFLYVSLDVRARRISVHHMNAEDKDLDFNTEFSRRTEELLRQLAQRLREEGGINIIEIDTSATGVGEVARAVLKSHNAAMAGKKTGDGKSQKDI